MAQIPVQPFDMGAPPPELPTGTSSIPDFGDWPEPKVKTPEEAPTAEWMAFIRQLTPEQQELALEWWPKIWNRPSTHLDGKNVLSLSALFMHIEGEQKRTRPRARTAAAVQHDVERSENAKRFAEWHEQCRQRQAWIDGLHKEWKGRIAARKQAMRLWDEHVQQAHTELQNAKNFPPPPRPTKR